LDILLCSIWAIHKIRQSPNDEIFFLAKNGTSLNVSTVKYTIAKYVKKAGIRKKASVHTLRHTFGAHKAECIRISNALFATPPRGHRRVAAATWWCVPVFPPHLRNNISLVY
jgi:site-specific recombinase XerC